MDSTKTYKYFLITPGSGEFTKVRKHLDNALHEIGLEPVRGQDEITTRSIIHEVVPRAIQEADFLIVDVTQNNPQVMFEAGFAHGLGKPILFMVQGGAGRIPLDLRGNLVLVYDPENPEELRRSVKTWTNFYLTQGNYVHGKAS
jgi:nucleoside 2-deoxyribosyltransferase